MIHFIRTDSTHSHFIQLVGLLDAELAERDGAGHSFYAQYNKINNIKQVVIAYNNNTPVACGAIKPLQPDAMEVKRMFTVPAFRSKGIAAQVLYQLELWAKELGYAKCLLETGKRQPEAIRLYQKSGYRIISNYGQYAGVENSVCFEKSL